MKHRVRDGDWIYGTSLAKTALDSGTSQLPSRSSHNQLLGSPETDKDVQEAAAAAAATVQHWALGASALRRMRSNTETRFQLSPVC